MSKQLHVLLPGMDISAIIMEEDTFMNSMTGCLLISCLTLCSRLWPPLAARACRADPLLIAPGGAMLPAFCEEASDRGQCFCTIRVTAAASAPSTLSTTLPSCDTDRHLDHLLLIG